jgi:hypothetical protein
VLARSSAFISNRTLQPLKRAIAQAAPIALFLDRAEHKVKFYDRSEILPLSLAPAPAPTPPIRSDSSVSKLWEDLEIVETGLSNLEKAIAP